MPAGIALKSSLCKKNRFFQKPCFYFLMTYLYGHPTKFNIFLWKRLVFLDFRSYDYGQKDPNFV